MLPFSLRTEPKDRYAAADALAHPSIRFLRLLGSGREPQSRFACSQGCNYPSTPERRGCNTVQGPSDIGNAPRRKV
jgi:hypothetical protein